MADDLGDRTEDATPKRLAEAREEGNVVKSHDLGGALGLLVITLALSWLVMTMFNQARGLMGQSLQPAALIEPLDAAGAGDLAWKLIMAAAYVAAPILLIAWAAAFGSQFLQVGLLFSTKAAAPNFKKLNPLNGLKRLFGLSSLVKSGMDTGKVGIVLLVAIWTIVNNAEQMVVLPYLSAFQAAAEAARLMYDLALRVLAVLLVLGFLDFMYQKWKHTRDLRMTKQQVKDEMRQSEGDPEVKRRRMRIQRQIAQQRISSAVPKADVIVTNPEHIAIAIQYDQARMNAPVVVAKGADYLAMQIRLIAMQHGIPIVERKPLARALYKQVAVNQEVPPEFYKAVAEILAYVYRLSGQVT